MTETLSYLKYLLLSKYVPNIFSHIHYAIIIVCVMINVYCFYYYLNFIKGYTLSKDDNDSFQG